MKSSIILVLIFLSLSWNFFRPYQHDFPTVDDGRWFYLMQDDLPSERHHFQHEQIFGKNISGYNLFILRAIDKVQQTAPEGGGYFMGPHATPPESPIGHVLRLFAKPLLTPPRSSSYCTGATYSAFIESLNLIIGADEQVRLSSERFEALRMQEPDGGRREDHVKFWGHWNSDNIGHSYALIRYTEIGREIPPNSARPGDFVNIVWKNNHGHAVIFLAWQINEKGEKEMLYWSSQPSTNGLGDSRTHLSNTKSVTFVRLTNPRDIFSFDVNTVVDL